MVNLTYEETERNRQIWHQTLITRNKILPKLHRILVLNTLLQLYYHCDELQYLPYDGSNALYANLRYQAYT